MASDEGLALMSPMRATTKVSLFRGGAGVFTALFAIGLVVPVALARSAGAATTITVTTTVDELNTGGACSLREAVRSANLDTAIGGCPAGSGADIIVVPAGTYRLTRLGAQEQQAVTGDLDILQSLTINGAGSGATILDGNGTERVLDVFTPAVVSVNDVAIQNGHPAAGRTGGAIVVLENASLTLSRSILRNNRTSDGPDKINDGGAIYNQGTVTLISTTVTNNVAGGNEGSGGESGTRARTVILTSSTVSNNTAQGNNPTAHLIDGGGGIFNAGTLIVSLSTVSGNASPYRGGGIANTGTATVSRSTISGNTSVNGGGLFASGPSTVVSNSTLSGNRASVNGGATFSSAAVTLASVTFTLNIADSDANGTGDAGSSYVAAGRVTLRNSVGDKNNDLGGQAPGCRVAGTGSYFSQGWNHFGGTLGCVITGPKTGDQVGGDAKLGPLQSNGGPTKTHALLAGSPAIDAGNPAATGATACPAVDQRGTARRDGNGDTVVRCDMGAFEF